MQRELSITKIKLIKRGTGENYYIRPSILKKQRMICLETPDKKTANNRLNRFIKIFNTTCDQDSFDKAIHYLSGKELKKITNTKLHIDDLIKHYKDFNEMPANTRPIKQQSMRSYEYRLRAIMKGAGVDYFDDLHGMSLVMITKSINPDSKPTTINNNFRIIKSFTKKAFLNYLKEIGIKITNPFKDQDAPKVIVKKYEPFDLAKQQEIWDCCEHLANAQTMIVKMALGIGLRRGEIEHAEISWFSNRDEVYQCTVKDVGYSNGEIWTPKSKLNRTIPIPKDLYDFLFETRKSCDGYDEKTKWMVPSDKGGTPDSRLQSDCTSVLKWLAEIGIKNSHDTKLIHKLRKQFGSAVLRNHGIYTASQYLGHSSITVTEKHYAGLIDMKEATIF